MRDDRVELVARQRRDKARRGATARRARPRPIPAPRPRRRSAGRARRAAARGIVSAVELAAAHAVEQRRAFDQLVARQRKQPPLRRAADRMAGAADALQEARDRARRAELADEIDVADVDAELERGGRDQRLELAVLQPLLGVEPLLLAPGCRDARSTCSSPSRSDSCRATRSAMRRVLTKTSVVRCASISSASRS